MTTLRAAPEARHFKLIETPVPEPAPGEVLVRSIYLSVDPYMRGRLRPGPSYAEPQKIGEVMIGEVVGEIVASRHHRCAAGDLVTADVGWQTHGVVRGGGLRKLDPGAAPISTALGVLGMPGLTAYFGTLEVLQPRPGDTLVVNAASGAVGAPWSGRSPGSAGAGWSESPGPMTSAPTSRPSSASTMRSTIARPTT